MTLQANLAARDHAPAPAPKWTGPRLELPMKALIDRAAIDAEIAGRA